MAWQRTPGTKNTEKSEIRWSFPPSKSMSILPWHVSTAFHIRCSISIAIAELAALVVANEWYLSVLVPHTWPPTTRTRRVDQRHRRCSKTKMESSLRRTAHRPVRCQWWINNTRICSLFDIGDWHFRSLFHCHIHSFRTQSIDCWCSVCAYLSAGASDNRTPRTDCRRKSGHGVHRHWCIRRQTILVRPPPIRDASNIQQLTTSSLVNQMFMLAHTQLDGNRNEN